MGLVGRALHFDQFFVQQLAYIAKKLSTIQEGEQPALDNTMLMFCSSMLTGSHNATQLPVIIVGGKNHLETFCLEQIPKS